MYPYKYLSGAYNFLVNMVFLKVSKVTHEGNLKIQGRIFIRNKGKINIGKNVKINSGIRYNPIGCEVNTRLVTYKSGEIIIGNDVGISNSIFISRLKIQIEDNVLIGNGCKIWDNDFHSLEVDKRHSVDKLLIKSSKILIKKNAFIGGCSIVLKGVTIGENSVIGAGSVVSKDIPNNEIWAGNPIRFIKRIN
jgi:acetyltransferase-like isoleucine patch superfamily enzyme